MTASVRTQVELHPGDRMTRQEFHDVYAHMPVGFRAELIGGIVYVPSPLRRRHSSHHSFLNWLFTEYERRTPGTEVGDNASILLGDDSEPQPDLFLRILPERGGQSRTTPNDYVEGAPELVTEVAYSSRSIDLHAKREDYTNNGVLEYLVLSIDEQRFHWFDLTSGRELMPDTDRILRLRTFPGLWVNPDAVFARDFDMASATLDRGISTPDHAAFLRRLAGPPST